MICSQSISHHSKLSALLEGLNPENFICKFFLPGRSQTVMPRTRGVVVVVGRLGSGREYPHVVSASRGMRVSNQDGTPSEDSDSLLSSSSFSTVTVRMVGVAALSSLSFPVFSLLKISNGFVSLSFPTLKVSLIIENSSHTILTSKKEKKKNVQLSLNLSESGGHHATKAIGGVEKNTA